MVSKPKNGIPNHPVFYDYYMRKIGEGKTKSQVDSDDIACFEIDFGEKVFIVHDYATEGFERRQEFDDFWSWFISAIKELIGIE